MKAVTTAFLLLVFCGSGLGASESLESDEFEGRKDATPRLILNPFGIFGNPSCTYNGDEGRCYGEVECLALAGNYGAFCPGLQGLCCLFYRTCGQRTSQEVAYFRNLHWPLEDQSSSACSFKVIRRSDKICGLKVQAEKVDLPSHSSNCVSTFIHITGAGIRKPMPLCGRSTGINYSIDFRHVESVNVHVNSSTRSSAAWNVKLTQVPCADFTGESVPPTGGSIGGGGGAVAVGGGGAVFPPPVGPTVTSRPTTKRPTTQRPTTPRPTTSTGPTTRPPTPQPPAPPPPTIEVPVTIFAGCGIKGSNRNKRDADFNDDVVDNREELARNKHTVNSNRKSRDWGIPQRNRFPPANSSARRAFVEPDNPFLRDLTYEGPYTNDSLFAYWKGPDALLNTRVTFGVDASLWEYPWQVAMFVGRRYHCGASVIGDWFLLTAAHCVVSYKVNPSNLRLSLGDWDVSNSNDGPYIEARVAQVRIHPSYSRSTLQNDLAVLKLTKKIDYTNRVRPVCLPVSDIHTDGNLATITGWGRDERKQLKVKLQELTSEVVTNALCGQKWKAKKAPSGFIVDTMMCMSAINGDSCNGDSGGPAVMEIPSGSRKYVQVGIVSFGSGSCTDKNLPGVYTRVSKFRDWIRQQMY